MSGDSKVTGLQSDGMTADQLKQHIENWMGKLQVIVKYDASEALKQLENLGLLVTTQRGITNNNHQYYLRPMVGLMNKVFTVLFPVARH